MALRMVLCLRTEDSGINMFYALKERFSPFISLAKEIREGGTFLSHYYEVGYKRQNTILDVESFKYFDYAYKFYKEHDCDYFIEIEVWQYKGKQEIVVLDWNESKEKFELAKQGKYCHAYSFFLQKIKEIL